MRLLGSFGKARRAIVFAALLLALAVLAGAATIGRAATDATLTPTVKVLNDPGPLVLGTPTPGGNIGYELNLLNAPTNTNTFNHIQFTDTIGTGGTVVYLSTTANVSCSGKGSSTITCTSAQLASGESLDVIVIFKTPTDGTGQVHNVWTGNYAPVGTSNKRTPNKSFNIDTPRDYTDSASGTVDQSLALPNDGLSAGGTFSAAVTMPKNGFLHTDYVGVTVQTLTGVTPPSGCTNCQPFQEKLTIPLASSFTITGPFGDGTTTDTHYFTWQLHIDGSLLPTNFKPVGVWHEEDGGGCPNNPNSQLSPPNCYLPTCATDANGNPLPPTSAPGECVSSFTTKKNDKNYLTYYGIGVNNGSNYGG
jgi:hypothetical protein